MEFEDILEMTGGYGKYQKKRLFLFILPQVFVIAWIWCKIIFMLSVPQHWCNVPQLMSNLSLVEQRAVVNSISNSACSIYNVSYITMMEEGNFEIPNGSEIIPCSEGWRYDTEFYEETVASKWNMVCEFNYFPSLLYTLGKAGSFIGTPIFVYLSDKFGRKIIFSILVGMSVLLEIAYTFSYNPSTYAVVTTFHGSLTPSIYIIPLILMLELSIPQMRARINFLMNMAWTLGLCVLPFAVYVTRKWTTLCYLTACLQLLFLCCFRFIQESPRWLITQGKNEEALKILMKIATENGKEPNEEELLLNLTMLSNKEKKKKDEHVNPCSILSYPKLRRRILLLTITSFTFTMIYSVLSYNIVNLNGNEFVNFFLMSIVEFPGSLLFWYAMNKFGRRWTAVVGYFIAGVCSFLPVSGLNSTDIISSMLVKCLGVGLIMVSNQQGAELFPTAARSFGIGTGKTISFALGMICPYIAYLGMYGKSIPFIVVGLTCFTACIVSSFLPETLGQNLPQTILDAELYGEGQKLFSLNRSKSPVMENQRN